MVKLNSHLVRVVVWLSFNILILKKRDCFLFIPPLLNFFGFVFTYIPSYIIKHAYVELLFNTLHCFLVLYNLIISMHVKH